MSDDLMSPDGRARCFGNRPGEELLAAYHDSEWGIPVRDQVKLFEMLTLEGAQAGLNWFTILKRREGYRAAFHGFDIERVADMDDAELEALRDEPGIIRNRLKIYSVRGNARAMLAHRHTHGDFATWLWDFVDGRPVINHFQSMAQMPATSPVSDRLSKELKRAGFSFVGSTIIYAFMQATGMVNDHVSACWCCDQPARR